MSRLWWLIEHLIQYFTSNVNLSGRVDILMCNFSTNWTEIEASVTRWMQCNDIWLTREKCDHCQLTADSHILPGFWTEIQFIRNHLFNADNLLHTRQCLLNLANYGLYVPEWDYNELMEMPFPREEERLSLHFTRFKIWLSEGKEKRWQKQFYIVTKQLALFLLQIEYL